MLFKPHTVMITFKQNRNLVIFEKFDLSWLDKTSRLVAWIKTLESVSVLDKHRGDVTDLEKYSSQCAKMLPNRLYSFLCARVPLQRIEIYPGRHLVWDSLRYKLQKLCVMIILSRHIID